MKQKEKKSLHTASVEELKKKLGEAELILVRLKKDRYTKHSKNMREGKFVRDTIARIKTILREKELST